MRSKSSETYEIYINAFFRASTRRFRVMAETDIREFDSASSSHSMGMCQSIALKYQILMIHDSGINHNYEVNEKKEGHGEAIEVRHTPVCRRGG